MAVSDLALSLPTATSVLPPPPPPPIHKPEEEPLLRATLGGQIPAYMTPEQLEAFRQQIEQKDVGDQIEERQKRWIAMLDTELFHTAALFEPDALPTIQQSHLTVSDKCHWLDALQHKYQISDTRRISPSDYHTSCISSDPLLAFPPPVFGPRESKVLVVGDSALMQYSRQGGRRSVGEDLPQFG